ncbi:MAG: hypothetical protein WA001_01185 [Patescibacteria group bacterium]
MPSHEYAPPLAEAPKSKRAPKRLTKRAEHAKPTFDEQMEGALSGGMKDLEGRHATNDLEAAEAEDAKVREPFEKLAAADVAELPRNMKELRASLMLALPKDEARGLTDAQRLQAGLARLQETRPKRAATIEEQLRSFDFERPAGPDEKQVAQIGREMRDKTPKSFDDLTAEFDKLKDLAVEPPTPVRKPKNGPSTEDIERISKDLLSKRETPRKSRTSERAEPSKQQEAAETTRNVENLRKTIRGEQTSPVFQETTTQTMETAEEEVNKIHKKLSALVKQKHDILDKMEAIKKSRSVFERIRSVFIKNTQLQEYQKELESLEAQLNPLEEDLQMLTYRKGLEQAGGVMRKVSAMPQKALEKEARAREERLDAEQEYGRATEKTAEELELEIAGPAAETHIEKQPARAESGRNTERRMPTADQKRARAEAQQAERDWVATTLGRERAMSMFNEIQDRMKLMQSENPDGYAFTAEGYVTNVAHLSEAMQQTKKTDIKEYAKTLQDWNKELGYPVEYNPLFGSGASRLKETRAIGGSGRARIEQSEAVERVSGSSAKREAAPRIKAKENMEIVTPAEQEVAKAEAESAPYESYLKGLRANPIETTKAIPNAAQLWDHLTKQMNVASVGKRATSSGEKVRIKNFANAGQDATDMILNLAAFKKATEDGNVVAAQKYQDAVATIAHNYLLQNDEELVRAYNIDFPEPAAPTGSRTINTAPSIKSRARAQQRVQTQNRRARI